jgi:hypothetical protein
MVIEDITENAGIERGKPSNSRRVIEFPMVDGTIVAYEAIPGVGMRMKRKSVKMEEPAKIANPSQMPELANSYFG